MTPSLSVDDDDDDRESKAERERRCIITGRKSEKMGAKFVRTTSTI